MSDDEIKEHVRSEARRILLAECRWGEPDEEVDPVECLRQLLERVFNQMASVEGHPSGAYRGNAEFEQECQEEYERLRRILNRAMEAALAGSEILNPGFFAWNTELWKQAVDQVRSDAVAFYDRTTANGEPFVGTAFPLIYSMAQFPYHARTTPLPAFSDHLRMLPSYASDLHHEMVRTRRSGFLTQLAQMPHIFLPRPWETRHKACISILSGIPTDEELVPLNARTIADVFAAEARRINNLSKKMKI